FEAVTSRCLGLDLEVSSDRGRVIPGEPIRVTSRLWNNRGCKIDGISFKACLPAGWEARPINVEQLEDSRREFEFTVAETADLSCPYWLLKSRDKYLYSWPEGEPSGRPFGPSPVTVTCQVSLGSYQLTLYRPVVCRQAFPGGFRELPLAVIPPISLQPKTDQEFRRVGEREQRLEMQVVARNNSEQAIEGSLELEVPAGWQVEPGRITLVMPKARGTETVRHTVTIPAGTPAGYFPLRYTIRYRNRDYAVVVNPVRLGTPGLPGPADESTCIREEFIISPSLVRVHLLDVKLVENLRYAYVKGAKEELLEALSPLGLNFYLISDEEMGYIDLSDFDAVLIGPNAYLVREELRNYSSRFLEYVKQGGTLIVQFQGYAYQTPGFTPYPFKYNQPHDRVTHENAAITILDSEHVLFRLPNAIRPSDFDNWIRERGLYFFEECDKRYNRLLSCADPGEEQKNGGFMECQYGKGTFVYTGYSFFRQLPAGVPGAFRLFANLLALPEARILERIDFLKKISLFSLLTDEQLNSVARLMSERWEADGTYICRQGDTGEELYILYQGAIDVVKESNGQENIVYLAKTGDCLGEMGILADVPRTASLRTRGDVQLLVIRGNHFLSLLRQNPDISIQVIKLLVNRLAASTG
ncbi:MAG: cyclic nucleotide-binding domain-containing protein, partial [Gemmatimonadota bacterium]|nr:cyclic nucleotide-binding domain-containing protein [Gemmatimonadota bacterium]